MAKPKANALQAVLDRASAQEHRPPKMQSELAPQYSAESQLPKEKVTGRGGSVMIGAHFPKRVQKQLKIIAAEEDMTHQALIEEALDLLFVKKGKSQIAEL